MALDPKMIAKRLGAVRVGEVPDTGSGAFGIARLGMILKERLEPSSGHRPGKPTNLRWVLQWKVPMSRETEAQLIVLAEKLSSPEHRINPMQLAARLLEETLEQIRRQQQ